MKWHKRGSWRYSLRYYPAVMGTPPVDIGTWQLIREDGLFIAEWFTWDDAVHAVFTRPTV